MGCLYCLDIKWWICPILFLRYQVMDLSDPIPVINNVEKCFTLINDITP